MLGPKGSCALEQLQPLGPIAVSQEQRLGLAPLSCTVAIGPRLVHAVLVWLGRLGSLLPAPALPCSLGHSLALSVSTWDVGP